MTITFHTPYPDMRAQLTFLGGIYDLVTDTQGNLYTLQAPDGTHPFTIVLINGQSYTGNVTVTNNEGYIDVNPPPPPPRSAVPFMLLFAGIGMGLAFYYLAKAYR